MTRYYCDYCDTYLTHDSPVVRKQHNDGYKHKANVRNYYMQFEESQTQSLIDSKIMEFEAKTRNAFQAQVAASFQAQMMGRGAGAMPGAPMGMPPPGMPPRPMAPPMMGMPPPGRPPMGGPPQGFPGMPPPGMPPMARPPMGAPPMGMPPPQGMPMHSQ